MKTFNHSNFVVLNFAVGQTWEHRPGVSDRFTITNFEECNELRQSGCDKECQSKYRMEIERPGRGFPDETGRREHCVFCLTDLEVELIHSHYVEV